MIEFDTKAAYLKNGLRGTFLLLPLKAESEMDIRSVTFAEENVSGSAYTAAQAEKNST